MSGFVNAADRLHAQPGDPDWGKLKWLRKVLSPDSTWHLKPRNPTNPTPKNPKPLTCGLDLSAALSAETPNIQKA